MVTMRPPDGAAALAAMRVRACLLSGGASRRMGRDKALLPHPEGGSWLERTLRLLLELQIPVTLFSRHQRHLQIARALNGEPITALAEAPPWEGPLLALHRLMQRHPDERLLLCPVDMPDLSLAALRSLLAKAHDAAAVGGGVQLHLAHDGQRLQPLLGVYPSTAPLRADLSAAVQRGERRLQGWLATQAFEAVVLDPRALRNVNHPEAAQPAGSPADSPSSIALRSQRRSSASSSVSSSIRDAGSGKGPCS